MVRLKHMHTLVLRRNLLRLWSHSPPCTHCSRLCHCFIDSRRGSQTRCCFWTTGYWGDSMPTSQLMNNIDTWGPVLHKLCFLRTTRAALAFLSYKSQASTWMVSILCADVEDGFSLHLVERPAEPEPSATTESNNQHQHGQANRVNMGMLDPDGGMSRVWPVYYQQHCYLRNRAQL